jgi:hypothetical protein
METRIVSEVFQPCRVARSLFSLKWNGRYLGVHSFRRLLKLPELRSARVVHTVQKDHGRARDFVEPEWQHMSSRLAAATFAIPAPFLSAIA